MWAKLRPQQAGLSEWLGDCEPASLLCVGGWVTASWLIFLALADGVAAGRLAIVVCALHKLSWCKRSCNSLACQRPASLYVITRWRPTQWALELPWWAFASLLEAPRSCKIATNFVLTIILKIVQKHNKERGLLNASSLGSLHFTAWHCNVWG
jgi:hypothetical protein